jgi:TetR/AcrR family transcriptional repressor of nem operon
MARPRTFDEDTVLEAARDAFWKSGYAATSLDDLTAATGLGKGSLYAAFGGKRELFDRVFRDYCADAVVHTRARLEGPDTRAYKLLRAYVLETAADSAGPPAPRGCLVAKTGAELAGADAAIAEQTRCTYDALGAAIASCIAAAQRNGDITASANPRDLSAMLLATLRGIEALGKGGVPAATLRRAAKAALEALPRS